MFLNKLRRRRGEGTIGAVYGAIVAQARHPAFYRDYGVPDTTTGRFEMIVVHLVLVLRCLARGPGGSGPLGQGVFDAFCRDMDGNLREMGVGDLAVPREMRRMAEAFYGRAAAYDRALDMGDTTTLAQALSGNVFDLPGLSAEPAWSPRVLSPQVWRLARYMQEAAQKPSVADGAGPEDAPPAFPDPESIAVAATALRNTRRYAMSNRERPWSVPVRVDDIPEAGRHVELAADDLTRQAIADLAGLRALPRLEAVFDLSRHGRNGLRLAGQVTALAGQTCVVTLDPIEGAVAEAVDLVFAPPLPPADTERVPQDLPQDLAIEAGNELEELVDGAIDLGAVATEFLLLGLDPYPRKPGAEFAVPPAPETKEGPFAALAALKTGRKPGT